MWFYIALYFKSEHGGRRKKLTAMVGLLTAHPVHHVLSVSHLSLSLASECFEGFYAAASV
jgi:hypothetical protein